MTTTSEFTIGPGQSVCIDNAKAAELWPEGIPRHLTITATVDCTLWTYGQAQPRMSRLARNRFGKQAPRVMEWPGGSNARMTVESVYSGVVRVAELGA